MTIEQEILAVINQIIPTIEKAFTEVFVQRHPGHPNQKVHGNRFGGYAATKESLRRLKDDKGARERYKQQARKRADISTRNPAKMTDKELHDIGSAYLKKHTKLKTEFTEITGGRKKGNAWGLKRQMEDLESKYKPFIDEDNRRSLIKNFGEKQAKKMFKKWGL